MCKVQGENKVKMRTKNPQQNSEASHYSIRQEYSAKIYKGPVT